MGVLQPADFCFWLEVKENSFCSCDCEREDVVAGL